ncbi:FtsK/SpoIIIE family DNA translocase [Thermincola potens]|uniref:Cell division FtsK/SpoIIIE n=1 Tax=Thermincola potens (strain JR) TaxID=635013 RepID=D5XF42_THEPJ|nr:DNA translocase FtsK [Thermincola potens]ADG82263.1 cell division FtsK/SpoIIIE [Thermincola potens JR]
MAKNKVAVNEEIKFEIMGISFLAFSVLCLVSLFSKTTGAVGEFVDMALQRLAGEGKYIFPFIVAFYGFKLIKERRKTKFSHQLLGAAALLAMVLTFIHIQSEEKSLFQAGWEGRGGGIIGGAFSAVFINLFGKTGTYIILITLFIINVILITNISAITLFKRFTANVLAFMQRLKEGIADFIFTEEEEVEVPDQSPVGEPQLPIFANKKKAPIFLDNGVLQYEDGVSGQGREIKFADYADDGDEPQVNIYSEPIEKLTESGSELARIDAIIEKRGKGKNKVNAELETPELKVGGGGEDGYNLPPLSLLTKNVKLKSTRMSKDITDNVRILEETLANFGVKARVTQVSRGPAITRYELQPAPGVKVSRIVSLADDIALSMAASDVRIEAPIPGKAAVGIEVPNKEISMVHVRELFESPEFMNSSSKLTVALGKDIAGNTIIGDLASMPHLLIAGATGSGKSVCMNTLIASILYKAKPNEVKLIMIDPKMVELTTYNGIPHLIAPVVTEAKKAAGSLRWVVREMEKRYEKFAQAGVKDIKRYNNLIQSEGYEGEKEPLPFIVVVIDELADLMMVAPADVEDAICRLAQMARAAGIHLVVATQRPSVDVITGLIKANIPSRIAFAVSSSTDSRTILDMSGAEKLLGKGDMLFFPVGAPKPVRVQGAYLSDKEVEALVDYLKKQGQPEFAEGVIQSDTSGSAPNMEEDELFVDAVKVLLESGQASISMLQRRLRIGYARAARLIDMMEERGIVGGYEGSKPRNILITMEQFQRMLENKKS